MTPTFSSRCAALMVMALAAPVAAQDVLHYSAADGQQAGISVVALDPVNIGAAVVDAPYSAESVTEVTQVLADGNRIERRTTATVARASDGKTRREQQGFALGGFVGQSEQPIVTIIDPKTGVHITLNYDQKVAYQMKSTWVAAEPAEAGAASSWTFSTMDARAGVMIQGRGAGAPARRVPPPPAPPPGTFESPVIMSAPVAVAGAAMPWGGDVATETLEPRTIEGLRVEGSRVTMTIPAGAVGNTLPIEVVRERWFSPELQVVVMTRNTDPRFGETTYRLTNIIRTEPPPDLFKIPPDFRIEGSTP